MSNDTKIVWLPVALANAVEAATSKETKEAIVIEYCEKMKESFKLEIENLDDEALMIKGSAAKYRQLLRDVMDDHVKKLEEAWTELDKKRSHIHKLCEDITVAMSPVKRSVSEISSGISSMPLHNLDRLIQLLSSVQASLDGPGGEAIKILIKHYERSTPKSF